MYNLSWICYDHVYTVECEVLYLHITERRKRQRVVDGESRRRNWNERFGDRDRRSTEGRDLNVYRDNPSTESYSTGTYGNGDGMCERVNAIFLQKQKTCCFRKLSFLFLK